MNQVVTITDVFPENGVKNGNEWTRYDVKTAGGTKFQTFDAALGEKIKGLKGALVELEYEVVPRGQYENNVIKSAKASNGYGPASTFTDEVPPPNTSSPVESDRQLRIMRQSALDRAINTVAAGIGDLNPKEVPITDLFTLADQYISYFENGAA